MGELAGQAAIRTEDRRAMTSLLDCARMLQGRRAGTKGGQQPAGGDAVAGPAPHRLSDREREVAELVLAGSTCREIGDRLFISAKTVERHVTPMRSRLNCVNRVELLTLLRTILSDQSSSVARQPWPERPSA